MYSIFLSVEPLARDFRKYVLGTGHPAFTGRDSRSRKLQFKIADSGRNRLAGDFEQARVGQFRNGRIDLPLQIRHLLPGGKLNGNCVYVHRIPLALIVALSSKARRTIGGL